MPGIRNPESMPMFAGASVGPNLIVKIGAADQTVIPGAAATDRFVGVSAQSITTPTGERVDVIYNGQYEIKAGGTITRGAPITSDATGQGVVAAPAAGTNNGIVGWALEAAVSGDLFSVLIAPATFQG
jgi:hypothetical protein